MVCSTGLEPVSFALQASAMTSSAKNTWWSIRELNSFTISLQKKSAAHSYTPNKMEPNIRIKRMTYCLQGSCSIAELIGQMATPQGFEPRLLGPNPRVLPLDEGVKWL